MPGAHLNAFAEALHCLALQRRWADAIRSAEPDAERFNRAARLRAKEFESAASDREPTEYASLVAAIGAIADPSELNALEKRLSSIPMPFGIKTAQRGFPFEARHHVDTPRRPEVAFVRFDINGAPARTLDTLAPHVAHDITIQIRVANWPKAADRLIVEPVSIEPADCYILPRFEISRPSEGDGTLTFTHTGRLVLRMSHSLGAKPFEFKYRATFEPSSSGTTVDLIGHRTLRLESLDPSRRAISGFANIDGKLYELRNQLLTMPGFGDGDRSNAMTLLAGLGNVAQQALQGALFPSHMGEAAFQREVTKMLRARSDIGGHLEEHPAVGGGITDLSFHEIRLELKAESEVELTSNRLSKFADQTAQYVVASGKRIGVLCVLDSRPKTSPPVPAESLFSVQVKNLGAGGIAVVTMIIQGGLARPSDLSR